jgi:FkbM family methyltransferase
MGIKRQIRRLMWKVGLDVTRFTALQHPLARKRHILNSQHIETVLDVGANDGGFARELRFDIGYTGEIISFEPLHDAFNALERAARRDPKWHVHNYALGETAETRQINVAENSVSSSLLEMLPSHHTSAPSSRYIGKQRVEIRPLDAVLDELVPAGRNVYLKIDTQGFEDKVLRGAERSLGRIDTVQIELSLVPLYGDQLLFIDLYAFMLARGFTLIAVEQAFADPASGAMLQVDGVFTRKLPAVRS